MKKLIILSLTALMLSCGGKQKNGAEKPNVEEFSGIAQSIEGGEPSFQKALPTDGVYVGLIADADENVLPDSTVIELKGKTYVRTISNTGKEPETGLFQFSEEGQIITLIGSEGLNKFFVSDEALYMLDKAGNKV